MMVCQECGVNTVLLRGHAEVCSQYEKPTLTEAQVDALLGIDPAATTAVQDLGDAINDVVADRGMKSFNAFMKKIGISPDDPSYNDIRKIATMCLHIGAGVTVQVMIEQGFIDSDAVLRAAGVSPDKI